jgi:hypothetical protein
MVEQHTLRRPRHLLLRIHAGHRRPDLKPHRAAPVPALYVRPRRHPCEVVLGWAWVVDLLAADIVDCSAGGDARDVGCGRGLVASDVCGGGVLDAGLGVRVFGAPGGGPVCCVGFAVYDEAGKGVWVVSGRGGGGRGMYSVLGWRLRRGG